MKLITTGVHATLRLDDALVELLPEVLGRSVSKAKARKLIMAGAVYLNGRPMRIASKGVSAGSTIEARVDVARLFGDATARDRKFELTADRILFEDDDLIVIDKPPGLPAQPTLDRDRDNLFAAVHRFLSSRDGIVDPYVGVHQRLDRDTSGIVLFTKSRRVNAEIAEVFAKHKGIKIYQALTSPRRHSRLQGKPQKEWTIKNYLGKISSRSKRAKFGAVQSDGDLAETSFRVIAEYPRGIWIEAAPKTGRTHQIRVHLCEYGLPILGDDLYGYSSIGGDQIAPRLMLHASALTFPHPVTMREVSVNSSLPRDFEETVRLIKKL